MQRAPAPSTYKPASSVHTLEKAIRLKGTTRTMRLLLTTPALLGRTLYNAESPFKAETLAVPLGQRQHACEALSLARYRQETPCGGRKCDTAIGPGREDEAALPANGRPDISGARI
ncbi:hypothetical protein NDU88_005760 [Pleurodeles waltl]|uniref:Uncharacterized protein n=1 Tax=Pleurodeles waltl TaxID=8319 RepID=A0AAV7L5F9_PLEWA|nr:hypothetical protein NDU88_005760 [Pleurodeles waltl]